MKRILVVTLIIVFAGSLNAQFSIRAGMGIDFASTPSLTDYINQTYQLSLNDQLRSFNSAIVFSGEAGYLLSENYMLAVDVGYLINSYTTLLDLGQFEFSYNIISPSLVGYYVISGSGYNFKFGGGVGIRFSNAEDKRGVNKNNYNSTGFGFLLRADGNTLLGGNIYANIGADLKYDLNGDLNDKVNLNSFSVGIRLGVTYIF